MMSEQKWRASLKAGDRVAIIDRGSARIEKVYKITDTQIVLRFLDDTGVAFYTRFRRSDGYLCGRDAWDMRRIDDPDSEYVRGLLKIQRCAYLRRKIADAVRAEKIEEETLRAALAILTPPVSETTGTATPGGSGVTFTVTKEP